MSSNNKDIAKKNQKKAEKRKNALIERGKGYKALDSFIKIANDFRIIPNEEYGEISLFSFNGKKIKAKRINGKLCMNLKQLTTYIEGNYKTIKSAFERHEFIEERHYFTGGNNLQPLTDAKYMTLSGVIRLLKYTRTGFSDQFLDDISDYMQNNMNPITINEMLFINKEKKLIPQYLGDPNREWVAEDGDILESRGEQIIDDILFKLKIPHQPKPRIRPIPEIERKYDVKYAIIPDWNVKVFPKTIIEYWGLDSDDYIRSKTWKQEIYKALGLRVINIESTEVQNVPILTKKLKDLLS